MMPASPTSIEIRRCFYMKRVVQVLVRPVGCSKSEGKSETARYPNEVRRNDSHGKTHFEISFHLIGRSIKLIFFRVMLSMKFTKTG